MITTQLASRVVRYHALDIASMLDHESVDLLRQAANATAAGTDWFLATAPVGGARLWSAVPVVVHVGPVVIDSPYEAHLRLDWRMLHATRPSHGHLVLRTLATATGIRPRTELRLFDVRDRWNPIRQPDRPPRRNAAHKFLASLANCLDLERSLAGTR